MVQPCLTDAFLRDLLFRTAQDAYRIALYTSAANLTCDTPTYTTHGEASGSGYKAGGIPLKNISVHLEEGVAFLDWDDPVWPASSITACCALIYNATRGNVSVACLDLGQNYVSTNGNFIVLMPEPTPQTAVIALGGR